MADDCQTFSNGGQGQYSVHSTDFNLYCSEDIFGWDVLNPSVGIQQATFTDCVTLCATTTVYNCGGLTYHLTGQYAQMCYLKNASVPSAAAASNIFQADVATDSAIVNKNAAAASAASASAAAAASASASAASASAASASAASASASAASASASAASASASAASASAASASASAASASASVASASAASAAAASAYAASASSAFSTSPTSRATSVISVPSTTSITSVIPAQTASSSSQVWIAGAVIGPIAVLAIFAFLVWFFYTRRQRRANLIAPIHQAPSPQFSDKRAAASHELGTDRPVQVSPVDHPRETDSRAWQASDGAAGADALQQGPYGGNVDAYGSSASRNPATLHSNDFTSYRGYELES